MEFLCVLHTLKRFFREIISIFILEAWSCALRLRRLKFNNKWRDSRKFHTHNNLFKFFLNYNFWLGLYGIWKLISGNNISEWRYVVRVENAIEKKSSTSTVIQWATPIVNIHLKHQWNIIFHWYLQWIFTLSISKLSAV